jgi:KaiC/GvpD/RAD55 family RecA-like ATPase
MSQLDVELAHAGEETTLSPKMLLLEKMRITPEKQLEPMEFLFRLFGRPCFPRRELVAITGKAKSGKTFVTSMLMACCVTQKVMAFERHTDLADLTDFKPLRVLWYDTEQSDESTQDILKNRALRMVAPTPDLFSQRSGELFDVFNVRAVEWKERRSLLKEAVERYEPDLVIVDGIRDLVNDINDGVLAQEVMEELLHLATQEDCCIVCVLHQNKSGEDRNLRGWIGTELMNKAFEVYACEKLMPERIFKMEQTLTRKYDIEQTMYFEVGENGLPRGTQPLPKGGEIRDSREQLPPLNQAYRMCDEDGRWSFDVAHLFLDAMRNENEVGGGELRERVMQLSGIAIPFKYNQLLTQALEQKIIEKIERNGRTFYRPAPF